MRRLPYGINQALLALILEETSRPQAIAPGLLPSLVTYSSYHAVPSGATAVLNCRMFD
ncbi:hypothetical protein MY4824_007853 [Beauveria thailandica]